MKKIIDGKEYVSSKAYWIFGMLFGMLFGGILMWAIIKYP